MSRNLPSPPNPSHRSHPILGQNRQSPRRRHADTRECQKYASRKSRGSEDINRIRTNKEGKRDGNSTSRDLPVRIGKAPSFWDGFCGKRQTCRPEAKKPGSQPLWRKASETPAWCRDGSSLNLIYQVGALMISLGFSMHVEPAHRNQGRLPFLWVLGQRHGSNHAHGRGESDSFCRQCITF